MAQKIVFASVVLGITSLVVMDLFIDDASRSSDSIEYLRTERLESSLSSPSETNIEHAVIRSSDDEHEQVPPKIEAEVESAEARWVRAADSTPLEIRTRIGRSVASRIAIGELSDAFCGTQKLVLGPFASMSDDELRAVLSKAPPELEAVADKVRAARIAVTTARDAAFKRLISTGRGLSVPTNQLSTIAKPAEGCVRRISDDDSGTSIVVDLWEHEDPAFLDSNRVLDSSIEEMIRDVTRHLESRADWK